MSCGNPEITGEYNSSQDEVHSDDNNQIVQGGGGSTGIDMNGATRTCTDQSAVMTCSMVFTPSDAFANDCRNDGKKAIMCACHDWICVN